MDLSFKPEHETFRDEVRKFLKDELTEELLEAGKLTASVFSEVEFSSKWHKILYKKGWIGASWPEEYGGTGWDDMQRYIFRSECASAGTPSPTAMGLAMVGPVLMKHGTQKQKDFYLPRILSGEDFWCQGYSEPGSGSDLASLQCKAVRDGDHYLVNGTKIWTTHAQHANRIFCLVRTDNSGKPQQGITFILIDMDTPGIEIKPIITLAGDHEVNQTFFDDVKVPVENVVGEENDGWTVAKYLLEFERGGGYAASLQEQARRIKSIASKERSDSGESLLEDKNFSRALNEVEIEVQAVLMTEHRIMSDIAERGHPGPASSILKSRGSELKQTLDELAVTAMGYYTLPLQNEARKLGSNFEVIGPDYGVTIYPQYLNNRASTIYGGSNEIQKNIMAKFVLGL
ncbi:MAG: acyl-CoA dehydrogenase [Rhodobiaceae bacterium]|jgi:alkylation response protein AidB-like acyl-CoA dehydrogenase|nr:acyl-CoA dehydrogenase [Rhodobiaceae bacterium]